MIRTNAVDSVVEDNNGDGHGERKLYLRRIHGDATDDFYRKFFEINSNLYGFNTYEYNRTTKYREKGREHNCYINLKKLLDYINIMIKINEENAIFLNDLVTKRNIVSSHIANEKSIMYFTVDYMFDSQERSYIRSKDDAWQLIREISLSRECIINIDKNESNNTNEFFLEIGQL